MEIVPALRHLAKAGRMEILKVLVEHPGRKYSINELSRKTGVPLATAWRAARDLSALGLALEERVGGVVGMKANLASPATQALANLEFPDPHVMAFESFSQRVKALAPGVQVKLFGSVAKGTSKPSSDVDVMVIYGGSGLRKERVLDSAAQAANRVLDDLHVVVSPLVVLKPVVFA